MFRAIQAIGNRASNALRVRFPHRVLLIVWASLSSQVTSEPFSETSWDALEKSPAILAALL